jgi:energy-coupling factor transporter ATP-binding protein EcfA2
MESTDLELTHLALEPTETEALDLNERPLRPGFLPALRASLSARLEHVLSRPLVAELTDAPSRVEADAQYHDDLLSLFTCDDDVNAPRLSVRRRRPWTESGDGTCRFPVHIDYDDLWRDAAKDVLETVKGTIEGLVVFLTDLQRAMLLNTPHEFLRLNPAPEQCELVGYRTERIGGVERVVELTIAEAPESPLGIRHVAIIPNLIPLERQLHALALLEDAPPDGPLAPLQVLLGMDDADRLDSRPIASDPTVVRSLDEHQAACVDLALRSPHFAVIQGPPGSGKTTTISTILKAAIDRGERVLVVSPTNVAVDNVIDKLTASVRAEGSEEWDDLAPATIPLRWASREGRMLEVAKDYWVSRKKQRRAPTLAMRLHARLRAQDPVMKALLSRANAEAHGGLPLSSAVASRVGVFCGTPIGLLSCGEVAGAPAGEFDLLLVDEVSKLTLPEFLAIAVKAKRWVLVGDPEQLPPYNNAVENGITLDDLLPPDLELVCAIAALLERENLGRRQNLRLAVAATDPEAVADALRVHLAEVALPSAPPIFTADDEATHGVVIGTVADLPAVERRLSPAFERDRTHHADRKGGLRVLVERGLSVRRPAIASGARMVDLADRAPARIFEISFQALHALPWARRANHRLATAGFRNGLKNLLPSQAALLSLGYAPTPPEAAKLRSALIQAIAERFALNAVSVYDWLRGLDTEAFDVAPLTELRAVMARVAPLREAVTPFCGTLRKQYRMHPAISAVPREVFYFGEALIDGKPPTNARGGVVLMQVTSDEAVQESNRAEADAIGALLAKLGEKSAGDGLRRSVMVITPYREQERALGAAVDGLRRKRALEHLDIEVCTLDRCQGREADVVFISLVKSRASAFLDAPKRWNVAMTRAMELMVIVGDIDAYLAEARDAQFDPRPKTSLLARLLAAYDRQQRTPTSPGSPNHVRR